MKNRKWSNLSAIAALFVMLLALIDVQQAVAHSLTQGLIAYYTFNGHANDASGNGNNGTVIGGVTPVEDRFGNPEGAMQFNGTNGYIKILSSPSLESPGTTGEITIAAFIYIDDWGTPYKDWSTVCCKSDSSSYNGLYHLQIGSDNHIEMFFRQFSIIKNVSKIKTDAWFHLAVTYDSTNAVKFYINGDFIGSGSQAPPFPVGSTTMPLEIGRDMWGVEEFFNGMMDEFKIYNRVLSADEVQALYVFNDTGSNTTTIPITTTTTITPVIPCPAEIVLGEDKVNLENLRNFRDSKLAQSSIGRRVIQIYYNNADSINAALDRSPTLKATTRRMLQIIAPIFRKN